MIKSQYPHSGFWHDFKPDSGLFCFKKSYFYCPKTPIKYGLFANSNESCYSAPVFETTRIFTMSVARELTKGFGSVAATMIAAGSLVLSPMAFADDAANEQQRPATPVAVSTTSTSTTDKARTLEAWEDAQDYSLENAVISYAVYGRTKNFTNEQLANGFVTLFGRQEVDPSDLKSWADKQDRMGASIYLYIDGVQFGPYGINQGIEEVPEVARMFLQHKPVMERRMAQAPAGGTSMFASNDFNREQ